MEASKWAGIEDAPEFVLKHRVSPGVYHRSKHQTIAPFRANTSGDDCASLTEYENTGNLQEAPASLNNQRFRISRIIHLFLWANLDSATIVKGDTALGKS